MIHPLARLVAAFLLVLGVATPAHAQSVEGRWYGVLDAGAQRLRLVVTMEKDSAGAWRGALRSVDQGNAVMPLSAVQPSPTALRFDVPTVGGGYAGTIDSSFTTIRGSWTQGGAALPLVFTRTVPRMGPAAAPAPTAPAEPASPASASPSAPSRTP